MLRVIDNDDDRQSLGASLVEYAEKYCDLECVHIFNTAGKTVASGAPSTIRELASRSENARIITAEAGQQAASISALMRQVGPAARDRQGDRDSHGYLHTKAAL